MLEKEQKISKVKVMATAFIFNLALSPVCLAGSTSSRAWPWRTFLQSLIDELTGPLPIALGTLGIAYVMFSMFSGNAGEGTKKGILIILAVSIALFAPTIMSWITADAGGLLIK